MDSLIPINIVIADRSYRAKIQPKDEETVRKTLKTINDKIIEYKTLFAGKDMQDYLAMVMLWYATEAPAALQGPFEGQELGEALARIEEQLDNARQALP